MDVIKALHKAENAAWGRATAYIILKEGRHVGSIRIAHPKNGAGILRAFLFDFGNDLGVQMGIASGGGYDKETAALCGLEFRELTFGDHPNKGFKQMLREGGYELIQAI